MYNIYMSQFFYGGLYIMFKIKNKLSPNLKNAMNSTLHDKYRVIIKCGFLLEKMEKKITRSKNIVLRVMPNINCICAILSVRFIERFIEYPEVSYIDLDSFAFCLPCTFETIDIENENLYLRYIDLSNDLPMNGKGVTVSMISTGIYPNKDLISPENRIVKSVDLLNNLVHPYDNNGMGTYMAGIIGGNGISSNDMIKGIAPRCNFHSIKAFDENGKGFIGDILYALSLLKVDAINLNIKVLCLPFEILDYNSFILDLFQKSFDEIVSLGITIVVPSGSNENVKNSIMGISTLNNIICVGGLNSLHPPVPFKYSSLGPCNKKKKPDFLAPCCNISTLFFNKKFISEKNGQKVYTPHLPVNYAKITCQAAACAYYSGICALLYEYRTDFTSKDIYSLLKLGSSPLELDPEFQCNGIVYLKDIILPKNKNKNK